MIYASQSVRATIWLFHFETETPLATTSFSCFARALVDLETFVFILRLFFEFGCRQI